MIPVIGIVGGIGSGKSLIARTWAGKHGAVVIDADAAGHAALKVQRIVKAVASALGTDVLDSAGRVDRQAVARKVFGGSPRQRRARAALEAIVHPWIARNLKRQIAAARRAARASAIVLDAAILLEAGWRRLCQWVVFVDCPLRVRAQRVAESRHWSASELRAREASQWPLARKRAKADGVIRNHRDLAQAVAQLERLMNRFLRSARYSR